MGVLVPPVERASFDAGIPQWLSNPGAALLTSLSRSLRDHWLRPECDNAEEGQAGSMRKWRCVRDGHELESNGGGGNARVSGSATSPSIARGEAKLDAQVETRLHVRYATLYISATSRCISAQPCPHAGRENSLPAPRGISELASLHIACSMCTACAFSCVSDFTL